MTKLQRFVVVLAAFIVICIVSLQANDSLFASHSLSEQQSAAPVAHVTINQTSKLEPTNVNIEKSELVTNIYQTTSGSFYFHKSNDKQFTSTPATNMYQQANLVSTNADINITGPIARTRLTQIFANTSDQVQSGIYLFPLPTDAAVDHLQIEIGDRKIEGLIKEKKVAKKIFVEAKMAGKKASLVEQLRPNMFSNSIANIAPHSAIKVTIEYQQFIHQQQHQYSLRLPLSITPRYTPHLQSNGHDQTEQTAQADLQPQVEQANSIYLPAKTEIRVRLNTGFPIANINSEHHPIKTLNPLPYEYQIRVDSEQLANKDFVLNWRIDSGESVQASHFNYQINDYEYGLITLQAPKIETLDAKRNLVFVLDVSGSMVGDSIEQAKQALAMAIQDLNDKDFFNVITFSSDTDILWHNAQQASPANKEDALTYLYNLEANGGTEIKQALDLAFSLPIIGSYEQDYLNQILFITDGSVSNEDEIMNSIYQHLGDYRLFTIGIGSAPNAYFMTEAASAGKGTFTYIGDIEYLKPKMQKLFEKLKRPALTDIKLNIKDAQQAFGFEIYPSILPDLYADESIVITYRRSVLESNTNSKEMFPFSIAGQYLSATANGDMQNRKWSSQLPATTVEKEKGLHKHWARLKIQDLSRQLNMRNSFNGGFNELKQSIENGITQVALEHHLVSKFTSLIAVEDRQGELVNGNDKGAKSLGQYAQARLPQTSTASKLYLFLGFSLLVFSLYCLYKPTDLKQNIGPPKDERKD